MEEKLTELINLFEENKDIKNIVSIKDKITDKEKALIANYRNYPTINNKKIIYDNDVLKEYLISENNLNYLIMQINYKLRRSKKCQK